MGPGAASDRSLVHRSHVQPAVRMCSAVYGIKMHDSIYPPIHPSLILVQRCNVNTRWSKRDCMDYTDWQQQLTHNMTRTRPNDVELTNRGFDDERRPLHIGSRSITKYLHPVCLNGTQQIQFDASTLPTAELFY